ncbi:MAG: tetratricopeptide repeat protein [Planctomycetota bacterium]
MKLYEDFNPKDVKYEGEVGREVKEIPGIYEYHWGAVEYNNFKTMLYDEAEKDNIKYRDLPDFLQKKREQGIEVDKYLLIKMEKHLNAAVLRLKNAVEENPKLGRAFLVLGFSYYQLQRYKEAIECFSKFIELHPAAANTYLSVAMCYQNMKKNKEALDSIEKALKIDPDNKEAKQLADAIKNSAN